MSSLVAQSHSSHGAQVLRRSPNQMTDCSRFTFYAPFVLSLSCNWDVYANARFVDVKIFRALASSDLQKPILPNLRSLIWGSNDFLADPCLSQFFGPQLINLQMFSLPQPCSSYPATALAVGQQSLLNLRSFEFRFDDLDEPSMLTWHELTQLLSNFICSLPHIQDVRTDIPLDHDALRRLAASSRTRRLHLHNDAADILQSITGSVSSPLAPELTKLHLHSSDFADIVRILELVCTVNLHEIEVHHFGLHDLLPDVTPLFETIGTRCSPIHLSSIEVEYLEDDKRISTRIRSLSALTPLFRLRNLTTLRMSEWWTFDLDDGDIKEIALAWPHLRYLQLNTKNYEDLDVTPRTTLASLVTLSEHCPRLWYLNFGLHIAEVDFDLLIPPVPLNLELTSLDISTVGHSVNPQDVADFLVALFPNLTDVSGNDYYGDSDISEFWVQVTRLLVINADHSE
jgi:hypothetical protein